MQEVGPLLVLALVKPVLTDVKQHRLRNPKWQKFNIPFGYHLLTVSLTVDKQTIILVKEILTI